MRFLVISMLVIAWTAAGASAAEIQISPSDDATVDSGTPNTNFGSVASLYVGDTAPSYPNSIARSYLKFDLGSLPAGAVISSAEIYLCNWGVGYPAVNVGAHYLASDSWSEGTITWNNAPTGFNASPTDLVTISLAQWHSWDVTPDVQAAWAGDGVYSVVMKEPHADEGVDGNWIGFYSRESGTGNPYLKIQYTVTTSVSDTVICEPQGWDPNLGAWNPTHPDTYWYDVTPDGFGRCDFHVRVYDPIPANYTGWTLPYSPASTWKFQVHQVGKEWWASWWDTTESCQQAIFSKFRFRFVNSNPSTWGDWRTTTGNSPDPYFSVVDSAGAHSSELDGYGYRVHVPFHRFAIDDVLCEPQGNGNPSHPSTYWYDVTPGDFGRCDFHVRVYDSNPANYTAWTLPYSPTSTWKFLVHPVGKEWWASWWDTTDTCQQAIFSTFRFQFNNDNPSVWGDWTTTTSNTWDPYLEMVDYSALHVGERDGYGYRVHVPFRRLAVDTVVCEPQGWDSTLVAWNPAHPDTYWYDVTPGAFGRCDFHVRVYDPNPANYTGVTLPAPTWRFAVHQVRNEWWASWWDPDCTNAIFGKFRFRFVNPNRSIWGHWTTTTSATPDPYLEPVDISWLHSGETDGYGYRVHVPFALSDVESDPPVEPAERPNRLMLGPAQPNPFSPQTTIAYTVPRAGPVNLEIYDVTGRLVRTLVESRQAGGRHLAVWDGRDDAGRSAASGVYFCRLAVEGNVEARKIIRLK